MSLAAESTQQIAIADHSDVKRYFVPISVNFDATMTGIVQVYAVDIEEAFSKVQSQIDNDTVDDKIQMEEAYSGVTMSYADITSVAGNPGEIVESDIEEDDLDEVTPDDVLRADVDQLESTISWDTGKLAKRKAFLEGLAGSRPLAV